jgi:hypothetical protein
MVITEDFAARKGLHGHTECLRLPALFANKSLVPDKETPCAVLYEVRLDLSAIKPRLAVCIPFFEQNIQKK